MTEDELKAIEAGLIPPGTACKALVAEVRRLQKQLAQAVAANLCHVPIQRVMGEGVCVDCGESCSPVPLCSECR